MTPLPRSEDGDMVSGRTAHLPNRRRYAAPMVPQDRKGAAMGSARTNATARNEYRRRLRKRGFSEDEIAELVAQRDERRALGLPALPVDALPRVRTCRNAAGQPKQAFRSKRSALMALSKTSTTDRDGRSTALLSPYLCPNCSLWHLGNARPSRTNRRP